jgi:hypothetical protein
VGGVSGGLGVAGWVGSALVLRFGGFRREHSRAECYRFFGSRKIDNPSGGGAAPPKVKIPTRGAFRSALLDLVASGHI